MRKFILSVQVLRGIVIRNNGNVIVVDTRPNELNLVEVWQPPQVHVLPFAKPATLMLPIVIDSIEGAGSMKLHNVSHR